MTSRTPVTTNSVAAPTHAHNENRSTVQRKRFIRGGVFRHLRVNLRWNEVDSLCDGSDDDPVAGNFDDFNRCTGINEGTIADNIDQLAVDLSLA